MFGMILFLVGHSCDSQAKDIRVMVVDTGVDRNHIDLMPYVEPYGPYEDYDDDYGHGTHIAGIIAGAKCPYLHIISCKAFFKGAGQFDKLTYCFNRALKEHIDIVNFSGGGDQSSDEEYAILKKVSDAGIKIVVAAGNHDKNLGSPCFGYFPACYRLPNETAVGALGQDDYKLSFSDYGIPEMKWAVGEKIFSTLPGNKYGYMSGTSQATAAYTKSLVQEMCYR
jgi:subtilisin family serine protease